MSKIRRIDTARACVMLGIDKTMKPQAVSAGPPPRADGYTIGIANMTRPPPHGGEMHPDGDELIIVLSGHAELLADSAADAPLALGPGDACIIPKGEWHRFQFAEPVRLLYITPGPNGEHRPLKERKNA